MERLAAWILALAAPLAGQQHVTGGCAPRPETPAIIWGRVNHPSGAIGDSYSIGFMPLAAFTGECAGLLFGFSNPALPVPPAWMLGTRGCRLVVAPVIVGAWDGGLLTIHVPNNPALRGVILWHQAATVHRVGAIRYGLSHGLRLSL